MTLPGPPQRGTRNAPNEAESAFGERRTRIAFLYSHASCIRHRTGAKQRRSLPVRCRHPGPTWNPTGLHSVTCGTLWHTVRTPCTLHYTLCPQALERARQQLEATNPNASEEGQQLFMALMRTMACKWVNGGDILVLEEVLISPPYTSESCALQSHSGSTSTLERVRKVLGGERAKLGLGASS